MTVATHFRRSGDATSLVHIAEIAEGYAIETHLWYGVSDGDDAQITLNLEERIDDTEALPEDILTYLNAAEARHLGSLLIEAADAKDARDAKEREAKVAHANEEKLKARLAAAPVVGDVVLIAPDPSALCPEERQDVRMAGRVGERYGSRWGEVKSVNYGLNGFDPTPGNDMRAWVTVTDGDGERSMWLHVDYLTPVAVMARTRATWGMTGDAARITRD